VEDGDIKPERLLVTLLVAASSNVRKVVITVGAIAAIGVASVVTGGAAGVVFATVAAGAARRSNCWRDI